MNEVKKNYVVKTTQRELKNLIKMSTFAAASEDNKVILTKNHKEVFAEWQEA